MLVLNFKLSTDLLDNGTCTAALADLGVAPTASGFNAETESTGSIETGSYASKVRHRHRGINVNGAAAVLVRILLVYAPGSRFLLRPMIRENLCPIWES